MIGLVVLEVERKCHPEQYILRIPKNSLDFIRIADIKYSELETLVAEIILREYWYNLEIAPWSQIPGIAQFVRNVLPKSCNSKRFLIGQKNLGILNESIELSKTLLIKGVLLKF